MNARNDARYLQPDFQPTRSAALDRLAQVQPADYASTRNALDGAVSRLSPYITHGLLTVPEVLAGVAAQHHLDVQHKFVFELGWREYLRHVWQQHGDGILQSLHEGPLPDAAYARDLPTDVRRAESGVPAVDQAVRCLYATGWLHNHARLWLASYLVHLRKLHWRVGADWMLGHLLDGDVASNHLGWQWVAGTSSRKPYLFNADNVARHAPGPWHSPSTAIDTSYDALDILARHPVAVSPELPSRLPAEPVHEPALWAAPARALGYSAPAADEVSGHNVWLMHPWALRAPPTDLPPDTRVVGLCLSNWHRLWPWTAARWAFVAGAMACHTPVRWYGTAQEVAAALRTARSVQTVADPHLGNLLPALATCRPPPQLFSPVDRPCSSFSQWWTRVTRGVTSVDQLPGLVGLMEPAAQEGQVRPVGQVDSTRS
jgi:deoxyribodipyrimidine photo-lyase